ncbi:MAG: transcription antiterminator [Terrisporobacter othiniensis]|nr:transcription antiterminator [Terrisporobacter othiniensis]MDU6984994.1 transcription antiterminator [Terrisporobacter othiniensis]MDY3371914.1 transcription antiterminator [Terrisporobacter othiniensis]
MDILTSRQIDFIKLMLEESEYKPIKYFTEKLNVSDKTLQKDLKIIGNYISKFNVKIDAKRGYGILIDSNASSNIEFINNLNINLKEKNSVSVDQRRVEILKMLLLNSNSSTSINQLSEKYYVSKTSIVNDLKYIEEWLKKYNIKLSKTLEGTKILGKETDIRKSIASLLEDILDQNNEEDKLPEITRIELSTFSALSNIFDLDSIMFIESIIWELEENLDYTISQPYYINLITHILICIKRLKEGNQIESKEDKIKLLDNLNEKVYENVINLIGKIEERYGVSINNEEIYYIYKYIVSSGFGNALDNNRLISENYINNSEEVTNMMIDIMSEFLNINLREDELLQKGLLLHIKPMLNRLNYDIQIKNPLLKEIKERFSEILGLCMLSIRLMSPYYNITNISIDEISYIATYFQAAVERSVSSKRVLVVCHSGYGTSQLLATRLKRAFPQWTIVDIVSVHRLSEVDMTNIDFIVSSVDIDIKDKMYIVVSALLMDRDVNNIKNVLMNASSEENSRNFNNLALEMEGNIFFNGNYNKEIDYILSNVKLEQVNLSKYYKIYINTSYEENKLITNIDNKKKTISLYILCNDYDYLKEILLDIYNLYISKKYINYMMSCEREVDIINLFKSIVTESVYEY